MTALPYDLGGADIVFHILVPEPSSEYLKIRLVLDIHDQPPRHIINFQILDELPEKSLHLSPVPVISRVKGLRASAAVRAPEVMREQDEVRAVLAGRAIVGQG